MRKFENDMDLAEALFDAARLEVAGETTRAGMVAIPVLNRAPVLAGSILMGWFAQAVQAYASFAHLTPLEAFDRLLSKPARIGPVNVRVESALPANTILLLGRRRPGESDEDYTARCSKIVGLFTIGEATS